MKRIFSTLFVATLFVSFATKAQTTAASQWKEKDDFHKVMAQTFHPMEEGNLEPIKTRSAELFEKAMAWVNSKGPADMDNAKVRESLGKLALETRNLNAGIINKKLSDDEIKTELTKAHDTFHDIVGLCKPGAHGHDHGHGHDHSDPNHKH